jgi:hypothetical protein
MFNFWNSDSPGHIFNIFNVIVEDEWVQIQSDRLITVFLGS